MAAREVAVAALGTVYAIEGGKEAADQIGQVLATKWSLATALSLLAWYIFAPQCASTLAVIRRETESWKWMAITFAYMLALAYLASLATYNIAYAFGAGSTLLIATPRKAPTAKATAPAASPRGRA
jgi:ferrous iron transport protein B